MSKKFTQIPVDTFQKLQLNAGVICTGFAVETGTVSGVLGATSGGISFKATPNFKDKGDDIDNCPKNTKELKEIDFWEALMSGTLVSIDEVSTKSLVAMATVSGKKITPANELKVEDFNTLWWVGDYSDEDGKFLAIEMKNALSTGGFSLQTEDKNKGKFAFEYMAHYSLNNTDEVPFNIYIG